MKKTYKMFDLCSGGKGWSEKIFMKKKASIFSKCYSAKSITEKTNCGILSFRFTKSNNIVIGPNLTKESTKKEVAEKLRQLYAFFYIHGVCENSHETLPTFPKFEKEIAQFPFLCYLYSYYFMKKPWKEAETSIAKDTYASLLYAINVLKKRFELGENSIKESPEACLSYCIKIMKRRPLPKIMHQAMLLYAIKESNNSTKKYFSYKAVKEHK